MVSVCIATYNGQRFIKQQLLSIIRQISENDEIIISDDHSTDTTLQIINDLRDDRIKIFLNPNEKGYTKNFENALKHTKGDIIFLSDQDDIWLESKVSKNIERLYACSFVVSDAIIVDENLAILNSSHFKLYNVRNGFLENFIRTRYIGACIAFKKEVLQKALPFPKNQKYCAHDYWLTLVAELYYSTDTINEGLILYRRHSSNALTGGLRSTNSLFQKIYTRFYCLMNLLLRYGK